MDENTFSITVAIITRDEESCITDCLDSLTGKFDEVIAVDTGSSDRTIEILKNHTVNARIFYQDWDDNFSEPRNLAIEKSSSDYIFFIDSDEKLISSRSDVHICFKELNQMPDRSHYVLCPQITDHTGDITYTVVRGFVNNSQLKFHGFIHEEVRSNDSRPLTPLQTNLVISHTGYIEKIIKEKNKVNRNNTLNKKNILTEPRHLRWRYFYSRDAFSQTPPEETFNTLKNLILINNKKEIEIRNIKKDAYTFPVIDLMARAKLMLMDSEYEFYNIIKILDKIIPNNSNAKYYTFLYELLNQKMKIKSLIKEIMKFKKKQSANETYGMIRSDGLHIDAILAIYLYEDGNLRQAYNLLSSVKENGFTTELTEKYLCKMKNMSGEQ